MTQQTDAASINNLTLSTNYFYNATSSAAGASSTNGVVSYNGTVQAGDIAGISGTIHNSGNGFFNVVAADNSSVAYQIVGSTADGNNLVFESAHTAGTNSGPYFILSSAGTQPPAGDLNYDSNNAYSPPVACYLEGTMILTESGERPIESLRVGDLLVTASGAKRPIVWIGHRTIHCAHPHEVLPFRIEAGAFSDTVPNRDLFLSPGHAVAVTCLEPVFVQIGLLANGATIKQVSAQSVTYWHVELESHDVIIANGLASETYLDVGNRSAFEDEGSLIALFPNLAVEHDQARYCLPCVEGGAVVHALREQLLRRATAFGWTPCKTPTSLNVSADGAAVEPTVTDVTMHIDIPAGARLIDLGSASFRPQDQQAHSGDQRTLGVCLHRLALTGCAGERIEIPLDHAALVNGFWPIEGDRGAEQRWTNGSGRIDLALMDVGFDPIAILVSASVAQSGWSRATSASDMSIAHG